MDRLWVEKYRPEKLDDLDYNIDNKDMLQKLSQTEDLPHLLFYGPNGAGKKTRIMCLLHAIFGPAVYKFKSDTWSSKVSPTSSTTIEIPILSSIYHIDITPCDAENYDRVVLQNLIKDTASNTQISSKSSRSFLVIVLNEVDKMSRDAQAALRRTMEKYVAKTRMILCCENIGKVIQPLRSRCMLVRVPAPTKEEVFEILKKIRLLEKITFLSEEDLRKIAEASQRNVRRAILQLQMCKMRNLIPSKSKDFYLPEWQQFIKTIAKDVLADQSPKKLREVREKIYELLVNCIPGEIILRELLRELIQSQAKDVMFDIVHFAAFHEAKMHQGQKEIMHIEAFLAKVMLIYKQYVSDLTKNLMQENIKITNNFLCKVQINNKMC